jgi:hypothetical protein
MDGDTDEAYSAIIGIKVDADGNIKLHIRENGDLSEDFWRNLPSKLIQSMGQGLSARRSVNE